MARFMMRRLTAFAAARRRACRPGLEIMEDRLVMAAGLSQFADALDSVHIAYGPPVVDQQGDIYTYTTQSLVEIPASVGSPTTIPLSSLVPSGAEIDEGTPGNECLTVDSNGDVFGTYATTQSPENIFEVPVGMDQSQLVNAQIGDAVDQAGIVDSPLLDDIQSLTVSNGILYGLSMGPGGDEPYQGTTNETAAVWEVPVAGGQATLLASWAFPGTFEDFNDYHGYDLTVSNGAVYGITLQIATTSSGGTLSSTITSTVFSVPTSGNSSWNTLVTIPSSVGFGLAMTGGYVYGITQQDETDTTDQVFDVPADNIHQCSNSRQHRQRPRRRLGGLQSISLPGCSRMLPTARTRSPRCFASTSRIRLT